MKKLRKEESEMSIEVKGNKTTVDREKLLNELRDACKSVAAKIPADAVSDVAKLKKMYENCFMDTAERTLLTPGMVSEDAKGNKKEVSDEVFIITGDIPAMWLRDSSAQVAHYVGFASKYPEIKKLIASLVRRQQICILRDPYANAYLEWEDAKTQWDIDDCGLVNGDWERKYETDSLSYHLMLLKQYVDNTGDLTILDETTAKVIGIILDTWKKETRHFEESDYHFIRQRHTGETGLPNKGKGAPVAYTGMTWTGFRPSDDACEYGYNIPENLFAAKTLEYVSALADKLAANCEALGVDAGLVDKFAGLKKKAETLRASILDGIKKHGTVTHPVFGEIYAYETDGLGNHLMTDDANVPSLLSLPKLDVLPKNDPIYLNTRNLLLSKENPYFYEGKFAKGIGSPHTPAGYIWPIGLIIQGMTGSDRKEQMWLLETLINTDADCLAMHESFDPDDPKKFTRSWFAWADSLFAEYVAMLFASL